MIIAAEKEESTILRLGLSRKREEVRKSSVVVLWRASGEQDCAKVTEVRNMQCLQCLYPLQTLRERKCPECGRPFDPSDARTYRSNVKLRVRIAQIVAKQQPSKRSCTLSTLGVVLLVIATTPVVDGILFLWMVGLLLGGFAFALWFVLVLIAREVLERHLIRRPALTRRWAVLPIVTFISVIAGRAELPLRFALWVSESQIKQAGEAISGPLAGPLPTYVGLFRVKSAKHDPMKNVTTIVIDPIFSLTSPMMAARRGRADNVWGNMWRELGDGWRVEWDNT
jgi:hypothetical protein